MERTLAELRRCGYLAEPVGKLFGIFDLVAVHPSQKQVLLVRAIARARGRDHSAGPVSEVVKAPATPLLLRAGLRVECWVWQAEDPSGTRGHAWTLTRRPVGLGSIPPPEV